MLKQDKQLARAQSTIGKALAMIPLSPNQWTLLSLLVALVAAFVIAVRNDLVLGLCLFAVAAVLDAVDGAVARARGETSALGGFIDGVTDRFVEAAFLLSLMFFPLPFIFVDAKVWLALVLFLGACMPSFIRAYADHKGVITREKALALGGVCERTERIIILVAGLVAGLTSSMEYFVYSLILVSLLSLITIIQRVFGVITFQNPPPR